MLREFSGETALQHVVAVNITQSMPLTKRIGLALPIARARKLRSELTAPAPAAVPWKELLTKGRIDPAYPPRPTVGDLAAVQYTSGTTGTPEGRHAQSPEPRRQRRAGTRVGSRACGR